MKKLIQTFTYLVIMLSSCQALAVNASCPQLDVDDLNKKIAASILNEQPLTISGCYQIDKSIVISTAKAHHKISRANIDMSKMQLRVKENANFPAILVKGVKVGNNHFPLEKSYIHFPEIIKAKISGAKCSYKSGLVGSEKQPTPSFYSSDGDNSQDIGIKIQEVRNLQAKLNKISGFCMGLALIPVNSCKYDEDNRAPIKSCGYEGVIGYNTFYNGYFSNNQADIVINSKHNFGWVNQNTFIKPVFASDSNNQGCATYSGNGNAGDPDQLCKDIMIDGKSAESNAVDKRKGADTEFFIDPPNNNSFIEPVFLGNVATSDNFYSRAGNHNMIYKANKDSGNSISINIGNSRASNRILFYGTTPVDTNICDGSNKNYHCDEKKIEEQSIKILKENTLPNLAF